MNLFYLQDYCKFIYMGSLYIYNIKDIEMHVSCFIFGLPDTKGKKSLKIPKG